MRSKKSSKKPVKKSSDKSSKKAFRKIIRSLLALGVLFILFTLTINLYVINFSKKYIFSDIKDVPEKYAVIVPGASVVNNRSVSHVLRDRIEAGVDLLQKGTVIKFMISGDHGKWNYDEVNTARKYVLQMHTVEEDKIFMDHAGFSTYETMYRARDVFCVTDCCIVTQKFHIYRAVYIARKLGLDAVGYISPAIEDFRKRTLVAWNIREYFARVKAFFDVLFDVKPTYLGDQIPITGDGHDTWK